jgi:hypothetical protein
MSQETLAFRRGRAPLAVTGGQHGGDHASTGAVNPLRVRNLPMVCPGLIRESSLGRVRRAKLLFFLARPKRFELLTPRFVVCRFEKLLGIPQRDGSNVGNVAPRLGKMKAARSPLFEAGGKRRRAPAGAKARFTAHPQERQHSAAEGGTRDRVRPAGSLRRGAYAARASGIVTRMGRRRDWPVMSAAWSVERFRARMRLEPGPKGTHQPLLPPIPKLGRPISTLWAPNSAR